VDQNEPFSTLKTLSCRKHSFQKLTQLSQRHNELDAAASNIGGFLWRDTRVSSSQLNRPIGNEESLSPCSKTHVVGCILLKTNSIVTGKEYAKMILLLTMMVVLERWMCFLNTAE
jgi:hypothetical protein